MNTTPDTPDLPDSGEPHALRSQLALLGSLLLVGALGVAFAGELALRPLLVIGLMLGMGITWGLGVLLARKSGSGPKVIGLIVCIAIALRIVALGATPNLSDDVWRYVWEGGLVMEGKSPYAQAPDAPQLAEEREAWSEAFLLMNNKDVSAAYPPVTQAAAAAVVALSGGPEDAKSSQFGLRVFFTLADLLTLVPLIILLRRRGLPDALLLTWAWCPLVVFEFACSAHFDSLGVLLMWSAFALLDTWRSKEGDLLRSELVRCPSRTQVGLGLFALAAAFLVKLLPLLAFPFVLRRSTLARSVAPALALCLFIVLGVLPVLALEGGLAGIFDGLANYGLRWESWNLLHRHVEPLFTIFGDRDGSMTDPRKLSKVLTSGLASLWILRLIREREEPIRATGLALAAFLIISPSLHPWYLSWIIPFLAFSKGRAWMFLVIASPLLYWPLTGWQLEGQWVEPAWLWPAVALPFFGLLILDLLRERSVSHAR
ncbi:MAG: hypothetical protein OSB10_04695 [Planctomycetota bacterium]|nr:hypothetical protein [Planctomycetota bacterium]